MIWRVGLGEFGHAASGNRLSTASVSVSHLLLRSDLPSIDLEAIHVHKYAVEHPEEDAEQSAEAVDVPEPPPDLSVAASSTAAAMDVSADPHGQKRADDETLGDSPKRTRFADKSFSLLECIFCTPAGKALQRLQSVTTAQARVMSIRLPAQT